MSATDDPHFHSPSNPRIFFLAAFDRCALLVVSSQSHREFGDMWSGSIFRLRKANRRPTTVSLNIS